MAEDKFYIFDTEERSFAGSIQLETEPIKEKKIEFHSILYTDTWDIREMIPNLEEKNWGTVYVLLNEMESKFVSFFKLPGIRERYLENAVLFHDTDIMLTFFEYYEEFYLPKELVTSDAEKYLKMIRKLHEKRIRSPRKKEDYVFLSICIPSYNRGRLALESVQHLLSCFYDSEIEIIVSNNGSTKDEAGYKEIQGIEDSRVRYHEFERNQGYVTNVIKVLEMAKGRYAVLASDEDLIVIGNMGEFMSYLKANPAGGVFDACGTGPNFLPSQKEPVRFNAGLDAISRAINSNYITGITYHMGLLKNAHAFEIVSDMRGNQFVETYVQIVFAVIAGRYGDFHDTNIMLWDGQRAGGKNRNRKVLSYMLPGSRVGQMEAALEILWKRLHIEGADFASLFLERCYKTYFLLLIAYCGLDGYPEIASWEEICFYVYRRNMDYIRNFPVPLNNEGRAWLEEQIKDLFLQNLSSERAVKLQPEEEQKKREFHQIIRTGMEADGKECSFEELFRRHWNCRGILDEMDCPAWDA